MKYFTPELYVRYCSPDPDVALAAYEEWERAIGRYRRRYRQLKPRFPKAVRQFEEELSLQGAEVMAPAKLATPVFPGSKEDVILVAQNLNTVIPEFLNTLVVLQYAVAGEAVIEKVDSDVFPQTNPTWICDEIDVVEPGIFSHEILISTGRIVKLRFRDFRYQIAPIVGRIQDTGLKGFTEDKAASA
jgi:hypothetical protein